MSPEATEFIELLQLELTQRELELPSYPNVAVQLQQLLADDNVSTDRVLRVVSAEPILAARIVRLASSAALNPRGTPVTDLRNAVARLGFNALRAAATSFAVTQLRLADRFKSIMTPLTGLWNANVSMAAAACVVARRCQRVGPDTALFSGLVSGVGRICLLARSVDSPYMAGHPGEFQQIVHDWHAEVAQALLTNWGVAEDIIDAVHGHQSHRAGVRSQFVLTDVLAVAELLSQHDLSAEQRMELLQGQQAAQRLGLRPEDCVTLMGDSQAELALLRTALAS
jgi:HD-like signal output (HDOD) protein